MFLKPYIEICCLVISMTCINSYVLFAANIDDFRSIAKKIIPGRLADQLADMASKTALNYRYDVKSVDEIEEEDNKNIKEDNDSANYYSESAEVKNIYSKSTPAKKRYVIKDQMENIDLDELVKRVKEKLDKEYKRTTSLYEVDGNDAKKGKNMFDVDNGNKEYEEVGFPHVDQVNENDYDETSDYADQNDNPQDGDSRDNTEYGFYNPIENSEYNAENKPEKTEFNAKNDAQHFEDNVAHTYQASLPNTNLKIVTEEENDEIKVSLQDKVKVATKKYEITKPNVQYNKERVKENVKSKNVKEDYKYGQSYDQVSNYKEDDIKEVPVYYEDEEKEPEETGLLKEVDLLQVKDSYEDYVTPKKENIFESEEINATPVSVKLVSADQPQYNYQKLKAIVDTVAKKIVKSTAGTTTTRKLSKNPHSDEIKAKTESLWYDDAIAENYDDSTTRPTDGVVTKTAKKLKGTMIPTRERFTMSSPNYIANVKAVAEKYNFDEPLPEKDREHENLKHVGNLTGARINKKVSL